MREEGCKSVGWVYGVGLEEEGRVGMMVWGMGKVYVGDGVFMGGDRGLVVGVK